MPKVVKPTGLYRAYALLSALTTPFFARQSVKKLRHANVSTNRTQEPLGYPSERRPSGKLIWFHAGSIDENPSILSLISAVGRARPDARFLITTETPISATHLPARCQHQFAPLDAQGPLKRFLTHWRPDAAVLIRSELHPITLVCMRNAGVPCVLIDPQMPQKSQDTWAKRQKTARFLLHDVSLTLTQTAAMAQTLTKIGCPAGRTTKGANLKSFSPALPVHGKTFEQMQQALRNRPVWAACLTYEGEEVEILKAHKELLKSHPDLCLILAPRHPQRGDAVVTEIKEHGLSYTRHSLGARPEGQVFLADTSGDFGMWYTLAAFVFIGGSITPQGGHNPFDAAHTSTPVLSGIHIQNFAEGYALFDSKGGARLVNGADELCKIAKHWLENPDALAHAQKAAGSVIQDQSDQLDQVAMQLLDAVECKVFEKATPQVT